MKRIFVDTSGFYAYLDRTDPFHEKSRELFLRGEAEEWSFFTSSFVIHESWALIQARLGWEAVEDWLRFLVPRCEVVWVPPATYERGAARCRQARKRRLSLTDCVSFEVMIENGCRAALADDADFRDGGFPLPGS
jgi:uncharacterized protein